MKILVSNDDGIFALGIKVLSESLAQTHEVYVVSPEHENSGIGCALTLYRPLRAKLMPLDFFKGVKQAWKIEGTPADSAKFGILELMKETPDMVISGINKGANLGNDVFYSGTVSVAFEGTHYNIPSIAISIVSRKRDFKQVYYENAAEFVKKFIEIFNKKKFPLNTAFNINVPAVPKSEIKGYRFTKLGVLKYKDCFEKRIDLRGGEYYWLSGDLEEIHNDADSDVVAIEENYISITPLYFDLTHYSILDDLRKSVYIDRW